MRVRYGNVELFSPRTGQFCYFDGSGLPGYECRVWVSCAVRNGGLD